MIAAAQTTVLNVAKLQRGPPMRAANLQKTVSALVISEYHELFAQYFALQGATFYLGGKTNRMPITTQHLPRRRSRPDAREIIILFFGQHQRIPKILDFRFWILDCRIVQIRRHFAHSQVRTSHDQIPRFMEITRRSTR
jgi:hypothetical protein